MDRRKRLTLIVIFLSFIVLSECFVFAQNASALWITKSPMKTPRSDLGVATVNGKIYAIGGTTFQQNGLSTSGGITGINEEYSPRTDIWVKKTNMPTPRMNFAITVYNNKIYCIGGISSTTNGLVFTGANEVYDPSTDTWETKAEMPVAKDSTIANAVNGKIYVIGGYPNGTLNEVYDPATDTWLMKTPMPLPGAWSVGTIDNDIYLVGSYMDSSDKASPITQIYNTVNDTWSSGIPPPISFTMSASAITTGKKAQPKIYVLPDSYDTIQVYDPENQSWNAGPNLPTSRNDPAIAVFEDTLYVIGGAKIEYPNMQSKSSGGDLTKYAINEQYIPENYGSYDTKEPINNDTTLDREQIVFLIVAILATPIIIIICLAYYKWKRQKPSTVDFSKTMQTENPSF